MLPIDLNISFLETAYRYVGSSEKMDQDAVADAARSVRLQGKRC
jgi:hypothetical protein